MRVLIYRIISRRVNFRFSFGHRHQQFSFFFVGRKIHGGAGCHCIEITDGRVEVDQRTCVRGVIMMYRRLFISIIN